MPNDEDSTATKRLVSEVFVTLLPELSYAINRVLEDCTVHFSKKVGVALWALDATKMVDEAGKYLTTRQLVNTFRDWFVVSERSANSEVSKVKSDLFDLNFISIQGGADHIHLNEKGEAAVQEMKAIAKRAIEATIGVLSDDEQLSLQEFAMRMIRAKKNRVEYESLQLDLPPSLSSRELF